MIEFNIWWNSAAADSFRAKNEDMDGEQFRPIWDAAVRAATQAPAPAPEAPDGMVLVNAAALNLARNCLKRDAEDGKQSRREILELLDEQTFDAAQAPAVGAEADRQLGSDREIALMEGHRIPAVDAYFKARPAIDCNDRRRVYEAGYQRGWRDSNTAHPVQCAATAPEPAAWVPYLSDRADGVAGHYAIARWNPRGFREVWNLRKHCWAAFSDDVMSLEEADSLLRQIVIPTVKPAAQAPAVQHGKEQP